MLGNVFVLGDSYSTYKGYIPEEYGAYYSDEGPGYVRSASSELELCDNDVSNVAHTWWYNIITENGTLLKNCSWSGTTICRTGYNGKDCRKSSFIGRISKLLEEGYFDENKVDTFFLFGGTNDSWADSPLGAKIDSNWTDDDLYCVLPAFSYIINLLISKFPDTKIYCIINDELKDEITEFYKLTCEKNGVPFVELHQIEKINGHPTKKGMMDIQQQVLDCLGLK